jgi:hypothetical protein
VRTIAWRLSRLTVGVFGLGASHYFGDGSLTHENAERLLTAKEGVASLKEQALQWRSHTERLTAEGLARPRGASGAFPGRSDGCRAPHRSSSTPRGSYHRGQATSAVLRSWLTSMRECVVIVA